MFDNSLTVKMKPASTQFTFDDSLKVKTSWTWLNFIYRSISMITSDDLMFTLFTFDDSSTMII